MNITDVDDKIISAAKAQNCSEATLTSRYIDKFLQNFDTFNFNKPDYFPRVTTNIDIIINYISQLLANNCAYQVGNTIYFSVNNAKDYGILSNRNVLTGRNVRELNAQSDKKYPLDFALWKNDISGLSWNSPFGKGRPGWHVECAALVNHYFPNQTLSIHGGGIDLVFPHHENELALHNSLFDYSFCDTWVYNGHLMNSAEKMSKSLNNFWNISDFLKSYSSDVLRFVFLNSAYQKPLNVSDDIFSQATGILNKWSKILASACSVNREIFTVGIKQKLTDIYCQVKTFPLVIDFLSNINNNLNTPNALSCLSQAFNFLRSAVAHRHELISQHATTLIFMLRLLGFNINNFIPCK